MKSKLFGISIMAILVFLFAFYWQPLTGCKKKEQPAQPPVVSQPEEPQKPSEPQKPQEPQPIPLPTIIKDVITFDVPYGKVEFTHKKHAETLKISCLKCHHTWEEGKVSGDLCKDCHKKQSTDDTLSSKDAFHKNCKGCHTQEKNGPTGCTKCHIKTSFRVQMQQ